MILPARATLLKALLIAVAGFAIFSPAFHGGWLWDDGLLIRENALIHDPAGLGKIWFEPRKLIDYFPLTTSVQWIEWHLFGDDTLGYHLVNIGLHVGAALLVWWLLAKLGLRLAWLGGLLFAVHPVAVESVAWISELKNTLSLPLFLLAMGAWIDFDREQKRGDYLRALGLFLAAMLAKSSMAMFPFIILLYAGWRRNRIGPRDLLAASPFFAISLVLGLVTLAFVHPALDVKEAPLGGPLSRLALAGTAIAFYFSKCLLPLGLLPVYPKWAIDPPSLLQFLPWPVILGALLGCWVKRATWGRHALLGLGFFLINLAPFVGFNTAAFMSFTWVMDHVLYIPLIGLIGLAVAACDGMAGKISPAFRPVAIGAVSLVVALLALGSHAYAAIFVSQEKLWSYTLQANPGSEIAHNNLGLVYLSSARYPQAIEQFEAALKARPNYAYAQNGLGNALTLSGHTDEAIAHYQEALRIDPGYAEAHNGMANVLMKTDHFPEARAEAARAIQLKPGYAEAHCNLGLVLAHDGDLPGAIAQFEIARKLSPGNAQIQQILIQLRAAQAEAK